MCTASPQAVWSTAAGVKSFSQAFGRLARRAAAHRHLSSQLSETVPCECVHNKASWNRADSAILRRSPGSAGELCGGVAGWFMSQEECWKATWYSPSNQRGRTKSSHPHPQAQLGPHRDHMCGMACIFPSQVNDRSGTAFAVPQLRLWDVSYTTGLGAEPCTQDTALERSSVLFTVATAPPGCPGVRFIFWLGQNQNWALGLLRVATKTRPSRVIYPEVVEQLCKESKRWGCECQVWQRKEEDKSWCEKAGDWEPGGEQRQGEQEAQAWSCEHCKKGGRQGCFCRVCVPQCRARPPETHLVQIPASLVAFPAPLCVQPAPGLSTPCSLLLPRLSL